MKPARKQELRALIVDIRGVAATDTETHARVQSGALTQLTKSMYCDTEAWNGLKDHEQTFLRCCAASRQSTKAVLVGRSAARINGVWVVAQSEPVTLAVPSGQPPSVAGSWTGYTYRYMQLPIDDILSDGPSATPMRSGRPSTSLGSAACARESSHLRACFRATTTSLLPTCVWNARR